MHEIKKLVHIILGIFLIAVGVAGLVLPIINGVLFLLLGLILLSFESTYVERHLGTFAHRTKLTGEWYEKLQAWMQKRFK